MKAAKEDLHTIFDLIKSLSRSEKIHFKKFSVLYAETGQGKFIQLYDALDGLKHFDVPALNDAISNPDIIKDVKPVIHFLNRQLMSSLRVYHATISVETKQKDTLRNLDLLYSKGHFAQSKKILDKAKKEAYKYDKFNCIIALLEWEKKLISKYVDYKQQNKVMQKIFMELEAVIEKKINLYLFEFEFNNIYSLVKQVNKVRNEEELETWKSLVRPETFTDTSSALSFSAQLYFKFINSATFFTEGRITKALEIADKRMEYLNKSKDLIKDEPHHFVNVLGNVLTCRNSLEVLQNSNYKNNKNAFFRVLKRLNDLRANTNELKVKVFSNVVIHELGFYINTGDFNKAASICSRGEEDLKDLPGKLGKASDLCFLYYSAYAYFGIGKYEVALEYVHSLLSNDYGEIRLDLQCFARIIKLLILLEKEDFQELESGVKEADSFLTENERLFPIEKSMLKFFGAVRPGKLPDKKTFAALKATLEGHAKVKYAGNFDEYSHFIWWLDSKIKGLKLSQVISKAVIKQ